VGAPIGREGFVVKILDFLVCLAKGHRWKLLGREIHPDVMPIALYECERCGTSDEGPWWGD